MSAALPALNALVGVLNTALDIAESAISFVSENLDVLAAVAGSITAIAVAANALAIKAAIVTAATKAWAIVQAVLNAVMTANPIGLVIAAIAALVAAILWVRRHTEGWGTLWDAVLTFMKEGFLAWVSAIKLEFNAVVNGIMMGLDKIKLGWYKFKQAVGLGDSKENESAIAKINADVEARQKAITDGAKTVSDHLDKAKHAFDNVSIKWTSGGGAESDTNAAIRNGAGGGVFGGSGVFGGGGAGSEVAKGSAEAIATGGTRNTQITINFSKEMVKMEFTGGYMENKEQVESTLAESMLRVLMAAKASI